MTRVGAALALLALALCASTAAAQQAAPAPEAARDPANVFHWDTLALGAPPAASTAVEAQRPQASTPPALQCAELVQSCSTSTYYGTCGGGRCQHRRHCTGFVCEPAVARKAS